MKRRPPMQGKVHRAVFFVAVIVMLTVGLETCTSPGAGVRLARTDRAYNGAYTGPYLNRVAFPIGGIGAGMICLEGTGAISHVSVRNRMQFFHEPCTFATLCVKGEENVARVLEGPVPGWKAYGTAGAGNGAAGSSYGLPRFTEASFIARFPFGTVALRDRNIPLGVELTGWSPFIPGDADNSSLPVGGLEYRFTNPTRHSIEAVFTFNTKNFMATSGRGHTVLPVRNGFVLWQEGSAPRPEDEGAFAVFVDDDNAVVDHCWFRGGWWDAVTLTWRNIQEGVLRDNPPVEGTCPGASLFVPLALEPGAEKTVRVMFSWYVPHTDLLLGRDPADGPEPGSGEAALPDTHVPWYAGRFASAGEVVDYWRSGYDDLREKSALFRDAFYSMTLPDEVIEAVAANLTILKSPTVLRQIDGRLWCFEGCSDDRGCCHGSCTHVWNYAQAIPHLFPELERSLRRTEFNESQDARGHQTFRSNLPIRPVVHTYHAASDGQLGGIMKVYRDWRISGNTGWLRELWPLVRQSLEYSISTWDPREVGVLEEPHHNTYDIEYWGPDGHCSSFYLGALAAAVEMGTALADDVSRYRELLAKGRRYLETELYNGEYFYQKIRTEGLNAEFRPLDPAANGTGYQEIVGLLNREGPKYQYGTGCLSDGVLGFWIARMCGLGEIVDEAKVRSSLKAIYTYNLKRDLRAHPNPQRPSYALGDEGGLLLCTWPRGGELNLPFVYSNEVWTGIEYQVASHLMIGGMVEEGLDIVRTARDRYDGRVRNPFDEYECGHWYARALSSYGLLQGLTGVRYDGVEKVLYIDSRIGDNFRSFLSTETGFGTVGLRRGRPFVEMKMGELDIERVVVSGREMSLQ